MTEEQTNPAPTTNLAAGFLMKVKIDTAPVVMLIRGIEELRQMLAPIAESNRAFLMTVAPLLQQSDDPIIHENCVHAVSLGLLLEDTERALTAKLGETAVGDEAAIIEAAELAQGWGHLAMALRAETAKLQDRMTALPA